MDKFDSLTKHVKGRERERERERERNSKPPCDKESKEMTANCSLSVLDINYVTYSRKRV